ncbi:MAG: hypothetical protein JST92_17810 [Deltaproteobacteria bacterium]|nr:hypothetical protein [Deltaproteobacteria bacterium]
MSALSILGFERFEPAWRRVGVPADGRPEVARATQVFWAEYLRTQSTYDALERFWSALEEHPGVKDALERWAERQFGAFDLQSAFVDWSAILHRAVGSGYLRYARVEISARIDPAVRAATAHAFEGESNDEILQRNLVIAGSSPLEREMRALWRRSRTPSPVTEALANLDVTMKCQRTWLALCDIRRQLSRDDWDLFVRWAAEQGQALELHHPALELALQTTAGI